MNEIEKIQKIARIASSWWASVINNPKMDNGDNSQEGQFCMLLSKLCTVRLNLEEQKRFSNELYNIIIDKIKDYDNLNKLWLDVEYAPNKYLAQAADIAHIKYNNFPIKTTMRITKHCVRVRYGYGADIETLYADRFFYENEIKCCKEAIKDYNSREDEYFDFASREELINLQENKIKQYEKALLNCTE